MATHVSDDSPAFQIPTVDISSYLADATSSEAENIVNKIRAACVTSGFFQVTGHGIPEELREGVLNAAKLVFDLPHEEEFESYRCTWSRIRSYRRSGARAGEETGYQGGMWSSLLDCSMSYLEE